MPQLSRPLSPHLQIYRWQVSNTLSILHRLTGVALSFGALALAGWLLALASGPTAYLQVTEVFRSWPGQLLLLAWTFCFFYHLCNGLRHLAWDAGHGFDRHTARKSGLLVVAAAVIFTGAFWAAVQSGGLS